jgi:hypothetical protein
MNIMQSSFSNSALSFHLLVPNRFFPYGWPEFFLPSSPPHRAGWLLGASRNPDTIMQRTVGLLATA